LWTAEAMPRQQSSKRRLTWNQTAVDRRSDPSRLAGLADAIARTNAPACG